MPKIKLFVNGRKTVFKTLEQKIKITDKTIWFHAASLGEYEQGLPVMEFIKTNFPEYKIVISFFSPSGFEVKKNNTIAFATVYLPLDSKKNVKQFLNLVHPEKAFFIKYEFWPNYLFELKKRNIPTFLISGIFRKNQVFFKSYGNFYKKALRCFTTFFVQNENSKKLLQSIGFQNVEITGDTRFDRVLTILNQNNYLDFIENFKNNMPTLVVGSSWIDDENLLINYINNTSSKIKFIIAPHNIKAEKITALKQKITKKTVLFSEKETQNLKTFDVFIIDTVGILTKIYSYANVAYVGGGFTKSGVHNVLEPAVFGVPIVIGSNYARFAEVINLIKKGGVTSISNQTELNQTLNNLFDNKNICIEKGDICEKFVKNNSGATIKIVKKTILH